MSSPMCTAKACSASNANPHIDTTPTPWTYESLRRLVGDISLPVVLVDLDRFDANVRYFSELARKAGKIVRLASKSLRVPALMERAIQSGFPSLRGLMCYSPAEAAYLAELGFDDLLIGYPSCELTGISAAATASESGKRIRFTVDSLEHVDCLVEIQRNLGLAAPLQVCIDADMSWRRFGLHVGVQRSPVREIDEFERLLDVVLARRELHFAGVVAYEAQIAGVPDRRTADGYRKLAIRAMKRQSIQDVVNKRHRIHQLLTGRGIAVDLFNGGGTGSFTSTLADPSVTEITVGSGLLRPHLFDRYVSNPCPPAICFALPVTRCPQADHVTCQGGGFIASGAGGHDRWPEPILPDGLKPEPREGFGEVQTPLFVPQEWRGKLKIGDPIFFRPAKAGEIAERFSEYCLFTGGQIVDRCLTYRGLGRCFH